MMDETVISLQHVDNASDFVDRFALEWRRTRPEIDVTGVAGLLRVLRLAAHLDRELALLCVHQGLKPGQFQVLAALRRRDPQPLTATELAAAAILTSGAMTPILDKLEAQGMIRRQADDADRRARCVSITAKGRGIIDRALDLRMARHRELNGVLDGDERAALASILRKLLLAVEKPAV
ncbi:MAG: MarR family transcriptional regulator [Rhodospirillaceae bacterium]|jgi:DNA-binding MarR family transcriptional regulator|nr:MarR family transcriptional regulator [Rhodospirillaceae bacterium]